ncbi:MAG: hypothetical protein V1676_05875 [Candidatus Diapherotrites archaeon]
MQLFESKVRKVGTSLGVLIPAESAVNGRLKEGSSVKVAIIRKDLRLIDRMFGSFKGGAFHREHADRAF